MLPSCEQACSSKSQDYKTLQSISNIDLSRTRDVVQPQHSNVVHIILLIQRPLFFLILRYHERLCNKFIEMKFSIGCMVWPWCRLFQIPRPCLLLIRSDWNIQTMTLIQRHWIRILKENMFIIDIDRPLFL